MEGDSTHFADFSDAKLWHQDIEVSNLLYLIFKGSGHLLNTFFRLNKVRELCKLEFKTR